MFAKGEVPCRQAMTEIPVTTRRQQRLQELVQHLREDVTKVKGPQLKAMFDCSRGARRPDKGLPG